MYVARDIPAFVMYCVYEESRSSLLIESVDSMIIMIIIIIIIIIIIMRARVQYTEHIPQATLLLYIVAIIIMTS